MNKLLSLSLICLGIMGGARAQTCSTTITTYPYLENFDGATAPGWTSGGINSSWALGTPAKPIINAAGSGTKSWATGLTGNYNANEQSYVESPCFNLSGLLLPVVEMKVWWNSEFSYDGAVLQSSIDGGTTWQKVGAKNDPYNWYNDNSINSSPGGQPAATAEGWTGTSTNGSGGWVTAKHVLTGLGGQANVKLRIAFGSDGVLHYDGFAFDNFTIYDTPANDAGVTSIVSPVSPALPMANLPVSVTFKNYGTSPLTSATLGFSVNNVVQPTFPWTGNLALNATSAPVTIGNYAFPAGVHKVKAWSKTPNGAIDGTPNNDTTIVTVYSCNTLSGNFTINKGAVGTATNFTSFATAAQALASCGVSGPVVITVAPGSGPYNESINLVNIPGASVTNTITFNGNGNTVIGNPSSTNDAVLKLNGAKFVRLNNLKIETLATSIAGSGILLNNASNNIFNGCTISHNINSIATLFGINVGTGSNDNTFQNNTINGGYYGVYNYAAPATPVTNNQFIGNTLKDQYYSGFYLAYCNNTLIENNDISRPARANVNFTLYGFYLAAGTNGAIISKNRIHNTHDAASFTTGQVYGVFSSSAAPTGSENIVKNNVFYNINNAYGEFYGFYNNVAEGIYYLYNTITSDPAITYSTLRGLYFGGNITNAKFLNNIISFPSTATFKHAIYHNATSTLLVSNNNDLYIGTSGNIGFYAGSDKATLADWKATNTNAYDQNSVAADPIFISSANLRPMSTVVNNVAQALPAVTDDINGAVRSTTTPDMGAYEFTPAVNDAGIVAIVSPISPVTPGVNQAVQVTLRNFGTTTLTSATIGWSINGVGQTNYTWAGSLANLASAPVNIGNYTFPAGNFTLKVWSKLPNGAADGLAANDTTILQLNSCAPLAGNYTINKNNPTVGTNFHSFAEATQRLNSCGVSAPVTLTVVAGTGPYTEQLDIRNIPFASATNTVTFEGSSNTVSVVPGQKPGIVVLDGAKYVKVNNFVITADPTATTAWGVQLMNAADYNTISNNTINLPLNNTNSNFNGIVSGAATSAIGNHANYTKIQNNTINGGYYGIQLNGRTGGLNAVDNEIKGNQVKDAFLYGIYLNHATNTLVEGNDISRPTRANALNFNFIYLTGISIKSVVSKNKMHNPNDMAISKAGIIYGVYLSSAATPGNENIIKNNTLYNITSNMGDFYPFYNSGGNGAYYYHNTVATDPASAYNIVRGFQMTSASTNVKFINNNLSLPGAASGKYAIYISAISTPLISDNNNLYVGTPGIIGYYNGADKVTLANWKATNTNAYDQNSVSADPVFINVLAGNLKPNSVTIENLGQPLTAVTDDILGVARHATTPDMGAYEFGVPTNDVGITSVSTPNATGCGLTTAETITVTIKNYGANPQPAVPVLFFVDGVQITATPETYTTSPIASNASATYTFTATANLAAAGNHRIIAKTQLTGDVLTTNDADTLDITNPMVSTLPVTFDFETPTTGMSLFRKQIGSKANIVEHTIASSPLATTSTKGLIMDGITDVSWIVPSGVTNPWTNNPDHFSAVYMCVNPAGGTATDSLWLTFDMKQLFKVANANTNFRVTINGTQVGSTYRPPFDPTLPATPNNWRHIKVDLTAFKNASSVMIGLESNVMQEFSNGTGTANLIDNVTVVRRLVILGMKENELASKVSVYPNPSNGLFKVSLPAGKAFTLEVTDLTGKVLQRQKTVGETELKLQNQAKGIYLLKVSGENGSAVRKVIVE